MSFPSRISLLALFFVVLPTDALIYQAPLEHAGWQAESAPKVCRLRQSIPKFGDAVFEAAPGSQRFFVQLVGEKGAPVESVLATGGATLAAAAPFWNPEREARPLGAVTVVDGGRIVDIEGERVAQLLSGLKDGLAAEIAGRARQGDAAVQVVALPVYFRRAWRDYDACVQQLPPAAVKVASISPTVATGVAAPIKSGTDGLAFDYPPGEWALQPAQRATLESVRQALLADPTLRVAIDGYGNDSYRRLLNLELSRKRAQAVSDLLTAGGVEATRIALRFHGDEKISARRVVVKVE